MVRIPFTGLPLDMPMKPIITTVPQANPAAGYRDQKAEIDAAVERVFASGSFVLGREGEVFESEFAKWLGTSHAVGCASGTDALGLLLRGFDIGEGSSVVTVSHTSVATIAAIELSGSVPILVDIDRDYYTMDVADLAAVLENPLRGMPPVRAVIVVHLYGQTAEMGPLVQLCTRHGVVLIEDCSQAHGASYEGRKAGTLAHAAAFSLYPTKNLGGFGDGGIVAVQSAELSERITALRQYGWRRRYISDEAGMNSRLDEIQAAILRVRLRRLDAGNARRCSRIVFCASAGPPVRSRARLSSVRHPRAPSGRRSGSLARARHRDGCTLSDACPPPTRLSRPVGSGSVAVPEYGEHLGPDLEPADVPRAHRYAGRVRLRRPAGYLIPI
jgi:dTDP-4-amino-4,6-dideoxygalactose transaminase